MSLIEAIEYDLYANSDKHAQRLATQQERFRHYETLGQQLGANNNQSRVRSLDRVWAQATWEQLGSPAQTQREPWGLFVSGFAWSEDRVILESAVRWSQDRGGAVVADIEAIKRLHPWWSSSITNPELSLVIHQAAVELASCLVADAIERGCPLIACLPMDEWEACEALWTELKKQNYRAIVVVPEADRPSVATQISKSSTACSSKVHGLRVPGKGNATEKAASVPQPPRLASEQRSENASRARCRRLQASIHERAHQRAFES